MENNGDEHHLPLDQDHRPALQAPSSFSRATDSWDVFGRKLPKAEIVFFSQVLIIYILVIACIINISLGSDAELWIVVMSTCLGAILPQPDMKPDKHRHNK